MTKNKTFEQLLEAQVAVPENVMIGAGSDGPILLKSGNQSLSSILSDIKTAVNLDQQFIWELLTQPERQALILGLGEVLDIDPQIIEKSEYNNNLIDAITNLLNSAEKLIAKLTSVEKADIQEALSLVCLDCIRRNEQTNTWIRERDTPQMHDKLAEDFLALRRGIREARHKEMPTAADEREIYKESLQTSLKQAENHPIEAEMWIRVTQMLKDVAGQIGVKIEGRKP